MCLSLVTAIATAPHHPRNQAADTKPANITMAELTVKDSVGPIHLGLSLGIDLQDLEISCDGANRQFSENHRCRVWFGLFASFHFQKSISGQYCSMFPIRFIIVCWKCASSGLCGSVGWNVVCALKSCRFDSQLDCMSGHTEGRWSFKLKPGQARVASWSLFLSHINVFLSLPPTFLFLWNQWEIYHWVRI